MGTVHAYSCQQKAVNGEEMPCSRGSSATFSTVTQPTSGCLSLYTSPPAAWRRAGRPRQTPHTGPPSWMMWRSSLTSSARKGYSRSGRVHGAAERDETGGLGRPLRQGVAVVEAADLERDAERGESRGDAAGGSSGSCWRMMSGFITRLLSAAREYTRAVPGGRRPALPGRVAVCETGRMSGSIPTHGPRRPADRRARSSRSSPPATRCSSATCSTPTPTGCASG